MRLNAALERLTKKRDGCPCENRGEPRSATRLSHHAFSKFAVRFVATTFGSLLVLAIAFANSSSAQDNSPPGEVLTEKQRASVDQSLEKALQWLADQQQRDGSFPTLPSGQPGITSLCTLAFLSTGTIPGEGARGKPLIEAIDFILRCQRENGLFSYVKPAGGGMPGFRHNSSGHAAHYNHAISGVLLCEAYGMCGQLRQQEIREAVEKALKYSFEKQQAKKNHTSEVGGWRYFERSHESDMSMTSWQIMFMRSAKNAGFDVPETNVKQAVGCVESFFDAKEGMFLYRVEDGEQFRSRGVVGSGILALSLTGEHNTKMAQRAGKWLMQQSFDQYNGGTGPFHYGAFYTSQAMYQLGGEYWSSFYPQVVDTLVENQQEDGGWDIERNLNGIAFGRCYSTPLAILALTTPDQLLPLYQR